MAIWGHFSPKSAGGTQNTDQIFLRVNFTCFITRTYVSTVWASFRKIESKNPKLLPQKCNFWPFWGLLWPHFKNQKMTLFNLSEVTTSYRVQIILMDGRGENPDEQRDRTQNNSTISPLQSPTISRGPKIDSYGFRHFFNPKKGPELQTHIISR